MMKLISSLIGSLLGGSGDDKEQLHTSLTIHSLAFGLMVWVSTTLATILLGEQYFGRRIDCFSAQNFTESPKAIGEYCWQHGSFQKDSCGVLHEWSIFKENWLLQTYVYFFLRAAVCALPHIIWMKSKQRQLIYYLKSVQNIIVELENLWKKVSEAADQLTIQQSNVDLPSASPTLADAERELEVSRSRVHSMTQDVVKITKSQMKSHHHIFRFILLRGLYDLVTVAVFFLLDASIFARTHCYDTSDYYCTLPNNEQVRCMVPLMQFQWHAAIFALATSTFMIIFNIVHVIRLILYLCTKNAGEGFLIHVPLTAQFGAQEWRSMFDRGTYKFVSSLVLKNMSVLYQLKFLQDFVEHLSGNEAIKSALDKEIVLASNPSKTLDTDDAIWRRLLDD